MQYPPRHYYKLDCAPSLTSGQGRFAAAGTDTVCWSHRTGKQAAINGKTHVLRHTTGALVQRGANTQGAQAMMRHKKYSTTFEVYGHMDSGITDLAAEAIDRQVVAAGAPTMRPPENAEVIALRPAT